MGCITNAGYLGAYDLGRRGAGFYTIRAVPKRAALRRSCRSLNLTPKAFAI